jgi:hypothetical protein
VSHANKAAVFLEVSMKVFIHAQTDCIFSLHFLKIASHEKVKQSRYNPGVAQRIPGS